MLKTTAAIPEHTQTGIGIEFTVVMVMCGVQATPFWKPSMVLRLKLPYKLFDHFHF